MAARELVKCCCRAVKRMLNDLAVNRWWSEVARSPTGNGAARDQKRDPSSHYNLGVALEA